MRWGWIAAVAALCLVGCDGREIDVYGLTKIDVPNSTTVSISADTPAALHDAILVHEIGHAMTDVTHSKDPNDVMFWLLERNTSITTNDVARWQELHVGDSFAVYVSPDVPDWIVDSTLVATSQWIARVPVQFTVVVGECPGGGGRHTVCVAATGSDAK